ncbi:lipoyl synthase [bacterium]|nr:lipoyl synthase [bacterium]
MDSEPGRKRLPDWLRRRLSHTEQVHYVKSLLHRKGLNTVCQSASCPNISSCFERSTATFMILGNVCSRHCRFCGVRQGMPQPVDPGEPARIAEAVIELGLRHVVITSVTRDDLPDGGAAHFADTVSAIRETGSGLTIELLIPDFKGDLRALNRVLETDIQVLNHNVETVPQLYPAVRPEACFQRSLQVLIQAKKSRPELITKSGLMLGLGESEDEVTDVFRALRNSDCDVLTLGQYLAPGLDKYPVREFLHPSIFAHYQDMAEAMGFPAVKAGPFVRSSFEADALIRKVRGVSV